MRSTNSILSDKDKLSDEKPIIVLFNGMIRKLMHAIHGAKLQDCSKLKYILSTATKWKSLGTMSERF